MPRPSKALAAIPEAALRANPVVSASVCPQCVECITEDATAEKRSPSYIIREILEAHYAARIAEKKAPKLAGIES